MKTFVLGSCLLLASFGFGLAQHPLSVSVNLNPVYSRTRTAFDFPIAGTTSTFSDDFSASDYGYSVGLGARYLFKSRWALSAAIGYNYQDRVNRVNVGSPGTEEKIRIKSYRLQVPVLLNYRSSSAKLSPYFSAGVVWNHLYRSRYEIIPRSSSSVISGPSSRLAHPNRIGALVGAGIDYRLNTRLSVILQPYGMYQFNKLSADYSINRYFQLGLLAQVLYRL